MKSARPLLLFLFLLGSALVTAEEKAAPPAAKPKQFVYVLRLVPRLHDDNAWSDDDKKVVGRHFAHLTAATKAGQVILAGRTMEPGDKTFGLVIFEAADADAARTFMQSDPAVVGKVMTAELHPFAVVLQRK
ncbi:MAG TPA: YciI family protein [Opitutaceae bacterium]|nr:YciI family protein [Opitutaceae bacterium]